MPFIPGGRPAGLSPSSILVLGGSSAVGAAAIQLLKVAVPQAKILTTSSPRHHKHLIRHLGVQAAIDRSSKTLAADVRSAMGTSGVDAILDTVGAGSAESQVFDAFAPNGPKRYAQVWTGNEEVKVPEGVDSALFRSRDIGQIQGADNIMQGLQALLESGQYKLPLPLNVVGEDLDGLQKGLETMRKGVSGEKLIVRYN